ncbi:Putative ribonuclease H protein At1g65750 [Linum perenne]
MTPPRPDSGEDIWVWGGKVNGQFSVKSAYKILLSTPSTPSSDMWMSVWRWKGPNRTRHFLWLAIQQKLLTNDERRRRNMTSNANCEFCRHPTESVQHVLRDCVFAKEVWLRVGGFDTSNRNWHGDLVSWLKQGLGSDRGILFGIICWNLWKTRNERIFSDSRSTATSVAVRAVKWLRIVTEAAEQSVQNISIGRGRRTAQIAWDPGPENWVTLNSDGSVDTQRGKAAAGGLVRNSEGRCLLAFSMNLGICSVTRAELRGVIEGLHRTWEAGFRSVVAQLDSSAAISILTSDERLGNQFELEKAHFRELRSRDWNLVIKHTYREGNRAADYLASIGYGYPLGSHNVSISDCRLVYFLRYDCFGITEQRSIIIND